MFRDTETFATRGPESASLHLYDHLGISACDRITDSLRCMDARAIGMDPRGTSALTQLAYATAATCPALVWC